MPEIYEFVRDRHVNMSGEGTRLVKDRSSGERELLFEICVYCVVSVLLGCDVLLGEEACEQQETAQSRLSEWTCRYCGRRH